MTNTIKFKPFVPAASEVLLGWDPAFDVIPVPGLLGRRGGVVTGTDWVTGSARMGWDFCDAEYADGLAIGFRGRHQPLVCLFAAYGGARGDVASVEELRASAESAYYSGAVVYAMVAVSKSGVAASNFLCGLADKPTVGGKVLSSKTRAVSIVGSVV